MTEHVRIRLRPGLTLLFARRRSTSEIPADSWLIVGTRRVNLDRLPQRLARLVPLGYAHATAEQFEPLVRAVESRSFDCETAMLAAEIAADEHARRAEGRDL
jgi:hypothetical protein